jgi:branched-chain amino acid transport system ATP-binding protein
MSTGTMTNVDSANHVMSVDDIRVAYGGLTVLNDISFSVAPGEILGLVGPNGAGKSTAINVIAGHVRSRSGTVRFQGDVIDRLSPSRRSRLGLARTFQNLELFSSMTVFENVLCGAEAGANSRRIFAGRKTIARRRGAVEEMLKLLDIERHASTPVGNLSYGTKKLVELARVFVRQPPFVLLDEPVAGLNRNEKAEFVELFARLRSTYPLAGILVEHDMATVESTCERVVVLDAGNCLADGPVRETLRLPAVVDAYLGPIATGGEPWSED